MQVHHGTYMRATTDLLVDPLVDCTGVRNRSILLAEPKSNLSLSRLNRVRTVANVATHVNAEVAADRAWGRGERVRSTQKSTALLDDVLALPNHGDHGTRRHVFDQAREERLALEVLVVLLEVVLTGLDQLHSHKLVTTVLKALNDLADQTALDTVRLDHNVRLFARHVG